MDLYEWWFEVEKGYFYCVGERANGRLWETSAISTVETMSDHYRVTTENTVYKLFW